MEEEEDESLDRTIGAKVAMIDFAHSTFEGFMADPVLHTGPDSGYVLVTGGPAKPDHPNSGPSKIFIIKTGNFLHILHKKELISALFCTFMQIIGLMMMMNRLFAKVPVPRR